MATNFTSMGALFDLQDEDAVLSRLKALALDVLPEGWRSWQIVVEDDLDSVDSDILNKLWFALPTEGIARAFNPEAVSLKELPFKEMKLKMLGWAFCRGLIYAPSSLSKRVRGSSLKHDFFIQCIAFLKPSFISRAEADALLAGVGPSSRSLRSSESNGISAGQQVHLSSSLEERFVAQEVRAQRLEDTLGEVLKELQSRSRPNSVHEVSASSYSSSDSSSSLVGWEPPPLLQEEEDKEVMYDLDFSFAPLTKEREPSIPEPSPELEKEGLACQRFNTSAWKNIRYLDSLKEIQAGGSFARVKVNPELQNRQSAIERLMANMEGSFGTLTHGLLLQRHALSAAIKDVMKKHPAAAADLRQSLSSNDSPFRLDSDNLLQFTWRKRAELIANRRRLTEAKTRINHRFFADIPPADGFLYNPKLLSNMLKSQPSTSSGLAFQRQRPLVSFKRSVRSDPRSSVPGSRPSEVSRKRPAPASNRPSYVNTSSKGPAKKMRSSRHSKRKI